MSLTDDQKNSVRWYMGYPTTLANVSTGNNRDFAYAWVTPGVMMTLDTALDNMTPSQETRVTAFYLPNLTQMETDLYGSSGAWQNHDTDQAAVWYHNKNEVDDRTRHFKALCRRLANEFGFAPGPAVGPGGMRISRA